MKQEYQEAVKEWQNAHLEKVKWIREVYKPTRAKLNQAVNLAKGKKDRLKNLCKKNNIDISDIPTKLS